MIPEPTKEQLEEIKEIAKSDGFTEEELLEVYRELFPEEKKLSCPIPVLPATFAVSDGRTKRKR